MLADPTGVSPDRATIVSLTPLRIEADSRTYRQAASFARLGYRSIVVEREASGLDPADLPFTLISPRRTNGGTGTCSGAGSATSARGWLHGARRLGRRVAHVRPVAFLLGLAHIAKFILTIGLRDLFRVPRADLYYLHAPYQVLAVRVHSLLRRVPYIYDAHDFYSDLDGEVSDSLVERMMQACFRRLEAHCIRHAAAIVTVSDGVAALQQAEFGCRPVVIRNSHDRRLDRPVAPSLKRSLGLGTSDFLVVSVGQAKPGMAIASALDAFTELPGNHHLAFVGRNYERVRQLAATRGLAERVHFVDPVTPVQVVPFIADADAAILLYYRRSRNYENSLPNKFFQAVAAGLPQLYPAFRDIQRLAETYGLGLEIDPQSPISIRDAVLRLSADRELAAALGQRVRAAQAELGWRGDEGMLRRVIGAALPGAQTMESPASLRRAE
jgi:glycosyltransferase involved in cell wall biosynthesis